MLEVALSKVPNLQRLELARYYSTIDVSDTLLTAIANYCPKLTKLSIWDPIHNPKLVDDVEMFSEMAVVNFID